MAKGATAPATVPLGLLGDTDLVQGRGVSGVLPDLLTHPYAGGAKDTEEKRPFFPSLTYGMGKFMAFLVTLLNQRSCGLLNSIHQRMQRRTIFISAPRPYRPETRSAERSSVMTCLLLALTAQLICVSGRTIVCTDNSAIAQLLGVPACTITERSRSNDDHTRIQAQRD
jgi:hypothetical protein